MSTLELAPEASTSALLSAMKLAFACFIGDISMKGFMGLSMDDQIAFAAGNAGLTVDELIEALRAIADRAQREADALRRYRDNHGHA
jgi:hypothetical protein